MSPVLWLCVATALAKKEEVPPPPERPVPLADGGAAVVAAPGSLWAEVPARQLMGLDGNARVAGDLVTVRIVERTATNLGASTSTSRSSSYNAAIAALLGVEKGLLRRHPDLVDGLGISATSASAFDGNGSTTRDAEVEATLTCEVIEVMPGGNLHIWGWKQVRVNRETQYVVLDGVVRPRDIQMDNTVSSELLAQAKIEITGSGVVADKQGPGWASRVLDAIWPF